MRGYSVFESFCRLTIKVASYSLPCRHIQVYRPAGVRRGLVAGLSDGFGGGGARVRKMPWQFDIDT